MFANETILKFRKCYSPHSFWNVYPLSDLELQHLARNR